MPTMANENIFLDNKYNKEINIEKELKEYLNEIPIYITLKDCLLIAVDNNFAIPGKGETVWQAAGVDANSVCRTVISLNDR
jgi:hypothetical protein